MITIGLNKIYKRLLDHETHVSIIINDEVDNLIKLDFRGTPHYNTKTLYYREIVASCIEEVSKNPRLKSIDIYRYVSQRELLPLLDSNINIMKISILSAPYVPFLKKMRKCSHIINFDISTNYGYISYMGRRIEECGNDEESRGPRNEVANNVIRLKKSVKSAIRNRITFGIRTFLWKMEKYELCERLLYYQIKPFLWKSDN